MQFNLAKFALPAVLIICAAAPSYAVEGPERGSSSRMAQHAPPKNRAEKRPARPSSNHTWIGGYWEPQNDQWAWSAGRWEEPSEHGSRWIKPTYRHDKGGYHYEAGRWSR